MFNLFKTKKITIPLDNAQEVTELESWKVSWKVATSLRWGQETTKFKCFIKDNEAVEFKTQLEKSAEFIGTPIETSISKN